MGGLLAANSPAAAAAAMVGAGERNPLLVPASNRAAEHRRRTVARGRPAEAASHTVHGSSDNPKAEQSRAWPPPLLLSPFFEQKPLEALEKDDTEKGCLSPLPSPLEAK